MEADPAKYGVSVGYNRRDALEEWDRWRGFGRFWSSHRTYAGPSSDRTVVRRANET